MGNIFDNAADIAFGITSNVMGYDAEWVPKTGPSIFARVHYKEPTSIVKIGDTQYDPNDGIMEYRKGDFPGLIELVKKNEPENIKITIGGSVIEFVTVRDKKLFDGQTIQVKLMRK